MNYSLMPQMTKNPDTYFTDGCGRCSLGGTPECKVHRWTGELRLLRQIILSSGLKEEAKWGVPCYTHKGKNILMLSAFKDFCFISFFKGSLLMDKDKILEKPGENSQSARLLKFTDTGRINEIEAHITAYIFEAIEIEKAGLKVKTKKRPEPVPDELTAFFDESPALKAAFEKLTPGRQRGYIIYFSQPKQSSTRVARIEKHIGNIMKGIGMHDHYKRN